MLAKQAMTDDSGVSSTRLMVLGRIFDKTDGRCHLTGSRLTLSRYGEQWEVDHRKPVALGGTEPPNNLYPALKSANLYKGVRSARAVRQDLGTSLPESREQRQAREERIGLAVGVVLLVAWLANRNQPQSQALMAPGPPSQEIRFSYGDFAAR